MDSITEIAGMFTPDEWQAVGAIGTLLVATVAAIVALVQVRQAARLRRDQARPYVVAYVDRASPTSVDLVVRNFGTTAARDVRLTWDRPPKIRWGDEAEPFESFENLPVLVPGQEWRSIWDFNGRRIDDSEPPYRVTLRSQDSRGRRLPDEVFDLSTQHFANEMMWQQKGLHDIGASLEKIEKSVGQWSDGFSGLKVYTRDGDVKDARQRERLDSARAQRKIDAEPPTATKPSRRITKK